MVTHKALTEMAVLFSGSIKPKTKNEFEEFHVRKYV